MSYQAMKIHRGSLGITGERGGSEKATYILYDFNHMTARQKNLIETVKTSVVAWG